MCDAPKQIFIITCASDPPGRAGIAFAQAVHAVAMGREVVIFLELDGVLWASTEYKIPPGTSTCFDDPTDNLTTILDMGAEILYCSTCLLCIGEHSEHGILTEADRLGIDVESTLIEGIKASSFTELQDHMDYPVNLFVF